MTTKKRITKKQMKEDALVTATYQASRYLRDHLNLILGGTLVLVAVIAAVLWIGRSRSSSLREAESLFQQGMNRYNAQQFTVAVDFFDRVASTHGNASVGARAQYFLGNAYLLSEQYELAVSAFEDYLRKPQRFPLYERPAMDGKAVALENLGRYAEAAEIYSRLAESPLNLTEEKEYLWSAARLLVLADLTDKANEAYDRLEAIADPFEMAQIEAERNAVE